MKTDKKIDLEYLLGPGQVAPFMQEYLLKRLYILHREDPHFYDGLISLADFEALTFSIKTPDMYPHWFRMVKENKHAQLAELFNEKGIIPAQVMRYYQQGYSIIRGRLNLYWPPIHALCKNIEDDLSTLTYPLPFARIQNAVAFLTPSGTQGFFPHYDHIDAFILQLEGSKNWTIYKQQMRFPFETDVSLAKETLGDPIHTFCLNAGDLLYMPAGFPHEASTSQGHSMHLTLASAPYNWLRVIDDLAERDEQARGPLPFTLPDAPSTLTLAEHLTGVLHALSSQDYVTAALKKLKGFHLTDQLPMADDSLHQINQLRDLSLDTPLCKRYGPDYLIEGGTVQVALQFPGSTILLPRETKPALQFIVSNDEFTARSIPAIEHNAAPFALVQRLIGCGFLKTVEQAEHA